jgi:hypothetical protein
MLDALGANLKHIHGSARRPFAQTLPPRLESGMITGGRQSYRSTVGDTV